MTLTILVRETDINSEEEFAALRSVAARYIVLELTVEYTLLKKNS